MMKVCTPLRILAYIASAVALVSVILAGISRLIMQTMGLMQGSYMSLAIVAILFAIFFLLAGATCAAKKGE